jgi:hypothetical protein
VEQQSLYERLGGVNAIAMVVDRFSDAIVENPKLQRNPALAEWNESGQLAGLKFMRTLWLCQEAGVRNWAKPISIFTSHPMSSTRWERRSPARSTTSMCRSAKRRKSWRPSSLGRTRWSVPLRRRPLF